MSAAGFGTVGTGKIMVRDFEWPVTYAFGVAWQASNELIVAADVKRINWNNVMRAFNMTYGGSVAGAPTNIDFTMPQNWKNQTVYEIGVGYKLTREFTGRIGANIANNPIPDLYMNPLFPATIKNHYMLGGGYLISKASSMDASFTYAPKVENTNGQGVKVEHWQSNAQIMYSYRF